MNFVQARQDILIWIETFVEKRNPELNNWAPCPFSRKSRISGRLNICEGHDVVSDITALIYKWTDMYDVVIFVYDKTAYNVNELATCIETINKDHALPNDIIVLEDHPDDLELVNNVRMNQGQYILVLCQQFSKVQSASFNLKDQGYYNLWSKDYYDLVVGWREQYGFDGN